MNVWLTADHHLWHMSKSGGIIALCNRPFSSIHEMHEVMIERWNELVGPDDIVWHLADLSLSRDPDQVAAILRRLNGEIHLLAYPWHHDGKWLRKAARITGFTVNGKPIAKGDLLDARHVVLEPPLVVLKGYSKLPITLCHFPMESWLQSHRGSISCHGHCHGRMRKMENRWDVGVDCWDFYPVNLEVLLGREG